ncbi:MAG: type I methionyl aminopeptidase [Candidatus Omnitrophica bacterium]|nr:type I methionyl aminopeptidase [Candidatus Omnitrophota bacterium]MDD5487377.1 type I methionyl aminopeptidase [Candidatus Omnitrophota bacterium]
MAILRTAEDVEKIRFSGSILKKVFAGIEHLIRPGISTSDIDAEAERLILELGGEPAFKGYRGFPATICASVNEVVVHGIPDKSTILEEGDIIGVDAGVRKNGYYTDAARTYAVGKISPEAEELIRVTSECLSAGIEKAVLGNRVSDISNAIQRRAEKAGMKEVRMFVGHGIGKQLHEAPEVPNWGEKGRGPVLKEGMLLAIEPMINLGTRDIKVLSDGWTAVTKDGMLSAHFEDTVIVGKERAERLT